MELFRNPGTEVTGFNKEMVGVRAHMVKVMILDHSERKGYFFSIKVIEITTHTSQRTRKKNLRFLSVIELYWNAFFFFFF